LDRFFRPDAHMYLTVIPAKAGIQFKDASEGHKAFLRASHNVIETGFRPSPE
jgi:hypothetical protein